MFFANKQLIVAAFAVVAFFASCTALQYKAAGILPYSKDAHGKVTLLLGLSSVHGNTASDFGGFKDAIDHDDPIVTALREGCEELLFVFDTDAHFKRLLERRKTVGEGFDITETACTSYAQLYHNVTTQKQCVIVQSKEYIMYFVEIPFDSTLPEKLLERKNTYAGQLPWCWNETTQLVWVDLESVLHVIKTDNRRMPAMQGNDIHLYAPFVTSLLAADAQGILNTL